MPLQDRNHLTLATGNLDSSVAFMSTCWDVAPGEMGTGSLSHPRRSWLCLSCDPPPTGQRLQSCRVWHLALNSFQLSAPVCAAGVVEWKKNSSEGDSLYLLIPTGTGWKPCRQLDSRLASSDSNPMRVLSGSTEPGFTLLGTKMVVTIAALPQHALRQQMLEHPVHLLQRQ